jgi:hypothetical protein
MLLPKYFTLLPKCFMPLTEYFTLLLISFRLLPKYLTMSPTCFRLLILNFKITQLLLFFTIILLFNQI